MLVLIPSHIEPIEAVKRLNALKLKYFYPQTITDALKSIYPNMWCATECYIQVKDKKFILDERHCAICLSQGEPWMTLSCGHQFHRQCMNRWKVNCPLCRATI